MTISVDGEGSGGSSTSLGTKTPADAYANPTDAADSLALLTGYNGTTWDRLRVDAAKNLLVSLNTLSSGEDQTNNLLRTAPSTTGWMQSHVPTAGTKATKSQGAGAAGIRNVCTAVSFGFSTLTAPTATTLTVSLIDGASGGGTIIWAWTVNVPASATQNFNISASGLWLMGTAATAMTLEFSALLTACFEYVNFSGVTVQGS